MVSSSSGNRWRDVLGELDVYTYWQPEAIPRHTLFARVSGAGGWSMTGPSGLCHRSPPRRPTGYGVGRGPRIPSVPCERHVRPRPHRLRGRGIHLAGRGTVWIRFGLLGLGWAGAAHRFSRWDAGCHSRRRGHTPERPRRFFGPDIPNYGVGVVGVTPRFRGSTAPPEPTSQGRRRDPSRPFLGALTPGANTGQIAPTTVPNRGREFAA